MATASKAVVGKFEVEITEDGKFTVLGPAAYVKSDHYKECSKKIVSGNSAVINMAPPGYSLAHLIALAFQTDYAGWKGFNEMMSWGKKS